MHMSIYVGHVKVFSNSSKLPFWSSFPLFQTSAEDTTMKSTEASVAQSQPLKPQKLLVGAQIFLRTFAAAASLVAASLMLTDKQSTYILGMHFDAKYSYSPAFIFFAYANAVASAFSLVSLLLACFSGFHTSNPTHNFLLFLHDLFMMSLVLSASSAATAISYVGKYGNRHTGWMAICEQFHRFCNRVIASVTFSYLASLSLMMLTIISAAKCRHIQV